MNKTKLTRWFWKLIGRPHWNIFEGQGSWDDDYAVVKGGEGRCIFCGQYASMQFMLMKKCPVGPESCQRPPKGWICTRSLGHEGPCAAIPN